MKLRLFGLLALSVLVALASVTSAGAITVAPAGPIAATPDQALYPDDIFHPVDLGTFTYELRREVTGSAADRLYDFYDEFWEPVYPGLVPQRVNNGPFIVEWAGAYENPGRFAQSLRISEGSNIYTEWFDGDEGRGRYKDNALTFITDGDMQALYWWEGFLQWIDVNADAVSCGGSTRLINDEQAIRCTAPNLSREARVGLINATGLSGAGYTQTVSRLSFELWVTRDYYVPVRLNVDASGIDEFGDRFTGSFGLDFFDLDSEDITVDLPRS